MNQLFQLWLGRMGDDFVDCAEIYFPDEDMREEDRTIFRLTYLGNGRMKLTRLNPS